MRTFLLVIGAAILPASAFAQSGLPIEEVMEPVPSELEPEVPTGSRIPLKPVVLADDKTRNLMKDFGRCIYIKNPSLAEKVLLQSDPTNLDLNRIGLGGDQLFKKFGLNSCLGTTMAIDHSDARFRFSSDMLRTMLAEEAYLDNNKQAITIAADATEMVGERAFFGDKPNSRARSLAGFSDCVVFHGTEDADALVRSRPASAGEMSAVQALIPAISACLYEGDKIDLTPASIRGYVADGLWTRSYYQDRAPNSSNTKIEQ
ncbi:MAG: hypothetical protein VX454_04570 [Pseudomonadota bacterium]|jgi:hypothetical protein|nr:hypothetical protein [Pseudomonadota bacterium]